MAVLIGIDVGGTNLRLGVVDFDESKTVNQLLLIEEKRFNTDFSNFCKNNHPEQAWSAILNETASAIDSLRVKYPRISAVGIGFPGFIDPVTQKISQSPNLPGLSDVDLSTDLSRLVELPVITENDALAAAYGEYATRSDHISNLIYLGLGTGVGGGLILNGQPFQGQHGVAMEVGHITVVESGRLCGCGNQGCMEQYSSASGVAISYFEATGLRLSAHEIANQAYKGNLEAIASYRLAGKSLAQALVSILKVIDISEVVIGGGMSGAWSLLSSAFYDQLNKDLIPTLRGKVNVSISEMGDQAGIIGAAMLAQKGMLSRIK